MKLDDVKKLHQKKYRSQFGFYLVEGEHLVQELQRSSLLAKRSAYKSAHTSAHTTTLPITLYVTETWRERGIKVDDRFDVVTVSDRQMASLSDTKTPQGIIARVPLGATNTDNTATQDERCIYLHEIQDPGNLGTILRTLAWFGRFRLLLSPNSVDPFNSKAVRASMGAIFHVPLETEVTLEQLQTKFERFAYLDLNGQDIHHSSFADYPCYLYGNEARGVPSDALQTMSADAFTISGSGCIESLNLASAVSICAYRLAQS